MAQHIGHVQQALRLDTAAVDPLAGLRAALAPVSGPRKNPESPPDAPPPSTYLGAVL